MISFYSLLVQKRSCFVKRERDNKYVLGANIMYSKSGRQLHIAWFNNNQ